jgi:hypothetical protein
LTLRVRWDSRCFLVIGLARCRLVRLRGAGAVALAGGLKARLRRMRGLKRLRSAQVISSGQAFAQNLRRGHYELATDTDPHHRLATAFTELALAI